MLQVKWKAFCIDLRPQGPGLQSHPWSPSSLLSQGCTILVPRELRTMCQPVSPSWTCRVCPFRIKPQFPDGAGPAELNHLQCKVWWSLGTGRAFRSRRVSTSPRGGFPSASFLLKSHLTYTIQHPEQGKIQGSGFLGSGSRGG